VQGGGFIPLAKGDEPIYARKQLMPVVATFTNNFSVYTYGLSANDSSGHWLQSASRSPMQVAGLHRGIHER
jgi:hypothetical protein